MKKANLFWGFSLVVAEVLFIAYLDYMKAKDYISLDALYCLPVIQAARLGAIHAMRRSDSRVPDVIAVVAAVAWSTAEAAIIWPLFPLSAFALNVFTRSVTFTVIGRVVAKLMKERAHGRRDPLTNLYNRLEFFERFEIERSRSERSGKPYSVLFADIDRFKKLNDDLGHSVGDNALKLVAEILRGNSRGTDTACRFGGDEFVLLFPETDEASCTMLANRIKLESAREFLQQGWPISLSIGHATAIGKKINMDKILHEADTRMYSAKRGKPQ